MLDFRPSPPPAWILSLEKQWRLRDADTRHKDEKQIGKGEGEEGGGGKGEGKRKVKEDESTLELSLRGTEREYSFVRPRLR